MAWASWLVILVASAGCSTSWQYCEVEIAVLDKAELTPVADAVVTVWYHKAFMEGPDDGPDPDNPRADSVKTDSRGRVRARVADFWHSFVLAQGKTWVQVVAAGRAAQSFYARPHIVREGGFLEPAWPVIRGEVIVRMRPVDAPSEDE